MTKKEEVLQVFTNHVVGELVSELEADVERTRKLKCVPDEEEARDYAARLAESLAKHLRTWKPPSP